VEYSPSVVDEEVDDEYVLDEEVDDEYVVDELLEDTEEAGEVESHSRVPHPTVQPQSS
jgi:hypothetical protein